MGPFYPGFQSKPWAEISERFQRYCWHHNTNYPDDAKSRFLAWLSPSGHDAFLAVEGLSSGLIATCTGIICLTSLTGPVKEA